MPSLGQVAENIHTAQAFEETRGKDLALDSCVSKGRPGDRGVSVGQPGTLGSEDKVGGDLCQEAERYETAGLWSQWDDNAGQPVAIAFKGR